MSKGAAAAGVRPENDVPFWAHKSTPPSTFLKKNAAGGVVVLLVFDNMYSG